MGKLEKFMYGHGAAMIGAIVFSIISGCFDLMIGVGIGILMCTGVMFSMLGLAFWDHIHPAFFEDHEYFDDPPK